MAGRKKYSLEEAADLILRADSYSGSEPEVSCSNGDLRRECHVNNQFDSYHFWGKIVMSGLGSTYGVGWGQHMGWGGGFWG